MPSQSDYDVASTEYLPENTANIAASDTIDNTSTSTKSWNFGNYVIINPVTKSNYGNQKAGLSDCPTQFAEISNKIPSNDPNFYTNNAQQTVVDNQYDAHYSVGNYYQWNTATAGTGGTMSTTTPASGSICPKGWKLPTATTEDSFTALKQAVGGSSAFTDSVATDAPYYFVRNGYIFQSSIFLAYAGTDVAYWTSVSSQYSNKEANALVAYYDNQVNTYREMSKSYGMSIRCIAR